MKNYVILQKNIADDTFSVFSKEPALFWIKDNAVKIAQEYADYDCILAIAEINLSDLTHIYS